jgi:hypothetical protein
MSLYDTIEATTRSFISCYEDATMVHNPTVLSRHCTATCERRLAPASVLRKLGMPPDLVWSNADYEARLRTELVDTESVKCEVLDLAVDERKRTSVARVAHRCKLTGKPVVLLEFVWTLKLDESGTKVTSLVEFVDTAESLRYLELMKEVAAARESRQ